MPRNEAALSYKACFITSLFRSIISLLGVFSFNNTFEILNIIIYSFLSHIYGTKPLGMAQNSTQQEVLLVTGSGFANRQYLEKDSAENSKNLSQEERLKEACWNGMLKDMLPELFFMTRNAKLFLWQMREAQHFLALEMAEEPVDIDYHASIDQYCFMVIQGYS